MTGQADGQPTLKVAAVARRLGVAPATLRTWARRYGLGPSAHVAGAHRQYSTDDLARLVVMRRLTLEGVSPAEAARVAVSTEVDRAVSPRSGVEAPWAVHRRLRPLEDRSEGAAPTARDDRVRERYAAQAAALLEAARELDTLTCANQVGHMLAEHGVADAWTHVLAPTLAATGDSWGQGGDWIAAEHVLSDAVVSELHRASPVVTGGPHVLLACTADEQHSLPLHALAAAMAERGLGTRVLGARVPADVLLAAVARTTPRVVVVLAVLPVGPAHGLDVLVARRGAERLFAAGPGWHQIDLPAGVVHLPTLADALDHLVAVLSAPLAPG